MRKVLLFAGLLLAGLALSQSLPVLAPEAHEAARPWLRFLTVVGLGFIMIKVGHEFRIERESGRGLGRDYAVAMGAAAVPWVLVSLYFVYVLLPDGSALDFDAWRETLLAGRFAAPTSAGVLFTMLAAAGLAATWVYRKARVLAILDDIDTILLMIPLQVLLVGLAWQLGVVVLVLAGALWAGWRFMRTVPAPATWPWVLAYAAGLAVATEAVYLASKALDPSVPVHVEVLLPAFVLGCLLKRPWTYPRPSEERASTVVAGAFMVLVGLSLPAVLATGSVPDAGTLTERQPFPGWGAIALHALAVTALANLGKMLPLFCYRKEATLRERLGVSIAMWPRGEVGAGVLVVSLGHGIGGPVLTVAMLSLAANLLLTGVFIVWVKALLASDPARRRAPVPEPRARHGPAWQAR